MDRQTRGEMPVGLKSQKAAHSSRAFDCFIGNALNVLKWQWPHELGDLSVDPFQARRVQSALNVCMCMFVGLPRRLRHVRGAECEGYVEPRLQP